MNELHIALQHDNFWYVWHNLPMANRWYLRCNACNFRLPDNTAASNKCPQCGAVMHIHDYEEHKNG